MKESLSNGDTAIGSADSGPQPLRILILEDQPEDAALAVRQLQKEIKDFEYRVVSNGPDFERAVRDFAPAIVFSDYSLPSYSGMDALEFCRENHPDIPFLFVTGELGEERAIETLKNGAADYVLKDRLAKLPGAFRRALAEAEEKRKRREAEQAVGNSLAFLHLLMDTIPAPVFFKDRNLVYRMCNDAFATQILGLSKEEIFGRTMADLARAIPADLAENYAAQDRTLLAGHGRQCYEGEVRCADGKHRHYLFSKAVFVDADSQAAGIVGVMIDISSLKKTAQELQQTNKELARSNEDLEQFAYCASHDLKEPLRMIIEYLLRLDRKYHSLFDDKALSYIGFAIDGATRMRSLINGLLDFSRIGNTGNPPAAIRTDALLKNVLTTISPILTASRASVHREPLPDVLAEESLLFRVFQNLVVNAVKFRGKAAPEIHITATCEGAWAHFTVADNGIGIAEQYRDKIFELFQRLHGQAEYPGDGIGLAICKKIVEHSGGRIWVAARPGGGSMFSFTLPLATGNERGPHEQ